MTSWGLGGYRGIGQVVPHGATPPGMGFAIGFAIAFPRPLSGFRAILKMKWWWHLAREGAKEAMDSWMFPNALQGVKIWVSQPDDKWIIISYYIMVVTYPHIYIYPNFLISCILITWLACPDGDHIKGLQVKWPRQIFGAPELEEEIVAWPRWMAKSTGSVNLSSPLLCAIVMVCLWMCVFVVFICIHMISFICIYMYVFLCMFMYLLFSWLP